MHTLNKHHWHLLCPERQPLPCGASSLFYGHNALCFTFFANSLEIISHITSQTQRWNHRCHMMFRWRTGTNKFSSGHKAHFPKAWRSSRAWSLQPLLHQGFWGLHRCGPPSWPSQKLWESSLSNTAMPLHSLDQFWSGGARGPQMSASLPALINW